METNKEYLCTTAMYMALGAESALSALKKDAYADLTDQHGGHIGIMGRIAELAVESEEHLLKLNPTDFPGVYDYEVSQPFGAWMIENNPDLDVAKAELHKRIADFLGKGQVSA